MAPVNWLNNEVSAGRNSGFEHKVGIVINSYGDLFLLLRWGEYMNTTKGIFEPYININPTDNHLDDTVAVLRFQTNTGCTTVSGTSGIFQVSFSDWTYHTAVIASEPTTSYVFAMLSDPTGWIDFYVSSNRGSSWTYRRSWQSGPSFTRFFSASSKVGATRGTMFSFVERNDATDLIPGADNKYYILYAEWGSSPDTFRLWWLRFPNRSNKQRLLLQGSLFIFKG